MSKQLNNQKAQTYKNATGAIEYSLKNDMAFHYVMQKSKNALISLVCSLKGISTSMVKNLTVENPIELNNAGKETVMDLKLTLNSDEILNIELQMYYSSYWDLRSILYLCRAFDSIGRGGNYKDLKPTTLYCITDREIIKNAPPEFYSHYFIMNEKNHHRYTDKFGINVLQLNHTDLATNEDRANNLVYWAELFKATTWEEFKALASNNPAIEEVGSMIFELNTDNQAKELLEGQRRYREQMATEYAAGYEAAEEKLNPIIAELTSKITELSNKNTDLSAEIANLQNLVKNSHIKES